MSNMMQSITKHNKICDKNHKASLKKKKKKCKELTKAKRLQYLCFPFKDGDFAFQFQIADLSSEWNQTNEISFS